ncbi:retrovirus-related pol polyprotein from transposon TNT 1-94 [Tanacetum coccineum]|uniref:Retrovirus-related pol polyprotein from transposon TNT 1-94 n=1 Tax=Tanacetum coccineum TaxID=301880 RepID=A0ABQ5J9K8_9ASTR
MAELRRRSDSDSKSTTSIIPTPVEKKINEAFEPFVRDVILVSNIIQKMLDYVLKCCSQSGYMREGGIFTPNSARIKRYMAGLAPEIRGMLKVTQPTTIQSAILKARIFTDEVVSNGMLTKGSKKRKSMDEPAKVGGSGRDVKKAKRGTNFVATAPSREGYAGSQPRPLHILIIDMISLDELDLDRGDHKGLTKEQYESTLGWRRNDRGGGNQVRGRVYNASMNAAEAAKDSVRIMKKTRSPRVFNSDDIQAAGSDTRPPMLDRTDYESWSQRIRLYCRGKENGLLILQSIDQGPFELGTTRNTLGTTLRGANDADVHATNIVLQGLPKDIYKLINHNIEAKAIWDNVKMLLAGSELTKEDRESQLYDEFERFKMLPGVILLAQSFRAMLPQTNNQLQTSSNTRNQATIQDGRVVVQNVQGRQNQNQRYFAWGNGIAGNGGGQNRAGNANAGQGKPVKCYNCNGVGHIARNCTQPKRPQNSDYFKDKMLLMQAQENGAVLDEEELLFLADECDAFDSDVDDEPTAQSIFMANLSSVGNVIPYEQYLSVNDTSVVPSCANSALNDACVLSDNDANENLKKELHSVKLQLNSTMENNKIIEETVTALKQEFKQKETKFLTNFSNLKNLKDKLENKLHSQDQSIQTVHMMLNPTKVYDQKTKTAIGAQNPFYLRQAKKAQPALYDGEELLKTHHVPVIVPSFKEDLELAEITIIKMHEKMNDYASVEKRVKIIPPNYSKENFMATFTPQTQLITRASILILRSSKTKGIETQANASPLPVLPPATVYPPNTPVHLVPRMLPTTSQVNIGLAMKAVFENLEAEVDQNAIDLKSSEIERKNLLIANENLIAKCLSQDVFYTVTDSALTASQFHELSIVYNVAKTRAVELKAENLNLHKKIQNDDHDNMVKHISRLEVDNLNLQLKYQHLKDITETSKSRTSMDAPEFDAFFELNEKDAQLQTHRNTIRKLKAQISQLKANKSDVTGTLLP